MGAKPREPTLYQRVSRLVIKRVKLALETGKQLTRGTYLSHSGRACAVGAIAINGDEIVSGIDLENTENMTRHRTA